MHKLPIGTRFIIASKQCVIKPSSKNITAAFKLLFKSIVKIIIKAGFTPELSHFG